MGFLEPNIESQSVNSQATPLAGDLLAMIRGQIAGGTFGEGFGPNKELGTSARQFVEGLKNRASPEIRDVPTMAEVEPGIRARNERDITKQAANLREGMGISGARFGSASARGEGTLRADNQANLEGQLAEMTMALSQMGVGRDVAQHQAQTSQDQMILQGLASLFGMNQANMAPAFQLGGMGINPDNTVVSDSPTVQLLKLLTQGLQGAGAAASGVAALA